MNFGIRRRNRCPPAPMKRITYTKPFVKNFITNVKRKLVFDEFESSIIVEYYKGGNDYGDNSITDSTLPESNTPKTKEDLNKSILFDDSTVEENQVVPVEKMDEEYENLDKILSSFNISGCECKKDK